MSDLLQNFLGGTEPLAASRQNRAQMIPHFSGIGLESVHLGPVGRRVVWLDG